VIVLDDAAVAARLPWPELVAAIEEAVRRGVEAPARQNLRMASPDGSEGRLLVMPAWQDDDAIGLKIVTIWPDNPKRGLPSHGATYMLMDARSGHVRAVMAAEVLTHRRTAALSVLAARKLLPPNASRLLVIGTGPVAEQLLRAHAASGRFETTALHGRSAEKATSLARHLAEDGILVTPTTDLEASVRAADLIASATSAGRPFLRGEWLASNAHVALFGSFTAAMREADDAVMARASEIWVDSLNAIQESGEFLAPIASGAMDAADVRGDFAGLLARGGNGPQGITVFKSVGIALADFAAAGLALRYGSHPIPA
jgi:ornithine cyclodeaminase